MAVLLLHCSRTGELDVVFDPPDTPDPFIDVAHLQVLGISNGDVLDFGTYRWDQGPLRLRPDIPPDVERLMFVGVDGEGDIRSSGPSRSLDLILSPPDRPVTVPFWSVGRWSALPLQLDFLPSFSAPWRNGVLFGGRGADAAPCEPWRTAVWTEDGLTAGPDIGAAQGPRVLALATDGGRVVVIGGGSGCDVPDWAVVDPDGAVRPGSRAQALAEGAAYTIVSERLVVGAGGVRDGGVTGDVVALDPTSGRAQVAGSLDGPRTGAAAARISNSRVAVIGGRSRMSTTRGLGDVSIFSINTGSTQGVRLPLAEPRRAAAAAATRSGTVVVAGGMDGERSARSIEVAVFPEPRNDASGRTAELADLGTGGPGQLVDLDDGSLLWVPDGGTESFRWIQTLPTAVHVVPLPDEWVPLERPVVARSEPGRAVVADGAGRVWGFNAGPQALMAAEAPKLGPVAPGLPAGFVPQDPGAWSIVDGGLQGEAPADFSIALLPEELLVLTREPLRDFEVLLEYRVEGQARASLVFGLDGGDFDHLALLGTPRVIRAPVRTGVPVFCSPTVVPSLDDESRTHIVRIQRRGSRVAMDVDDDGSEELVCETLVPRAGVLALGVINGRVRFSNFSLARP